MGGRTRRIIPFKNTLLKPMAFDPSEVQRVLKEKQQVQKKDFDQRCRSLEPLKPGDSIMVRQIGTWEPGNQQCCWRDLTKTNRDHIL